MLGGDNARGQHIIGDVVVSFQYINGEPAMTLWSLRSAQNAGAYIIQIDAAFKYLDQPYLVQQAYIACEVMGMYPARETVFRVATIIFDHLEELVRMKPEREAEKKSVGEGLLIGGDGTRIHFDMNQ